MALLFLVLEWIVWGASLLFGLWVAVGIRRIAVLQLPSPTWPTLIRSFAFVAIPVLFLFLPFNKLHIIWLLCILKPLSVMAGIRYVPWLSQVLIWPSYLYATLLMSGTGVHLTSPNKKSPWAAYRFDVAEKQASLAIEHNLTGTLTFLGRCCAYGRGTPQNYSQAYAWFTISMDKGDEAAEWFRSDISKEMTPEQIAEGQRLSIKIQTRDH